MGCGGKKLEKYRNIRYPELEVHIYKRVSNINLILLPTKLIL